MAPSSRRSNSVLLSREPFGGGDAENDCIFLLGSVGSSETGLTVSVTEGMPTVALDDSVNARFGLGLQTVAAVAARGDEVAGECSLISGGSFVAVIDGASRLRYVVLERDAEAPGFPLHWTEPAGRCGELPFDTIPKECREELLIVSRLGSVARIVESWPPPADWRQFRTCQIERVRGQLGEQGIASEALLAGEPRPMHYEVLPFERPFLKPLTVMVAGVPQQHGDVLAFLDAEHNTLEVRQTAVIRLEPQEELLVFDGEEYERRAAILLPTQLRAQKLTPTLHWYLRETDPPDRVLA